MKTIGMIGGTSWHSTAEYYRLINEITHRKTGTNPTLLLNSLNIELMRRGDWEEIRSAFLKAARRLEQAGAEALVICANTPHKVIPFVQPGIGIPFLHIADATGREAARQGLSNTGLLGTRPVVEDDFIKGRLITEYGLTVTIPDEEDRRTLHQLIANELTRGKFTKEGASWVAGLMTRLKDRHADSMILACTELPQLLHDQHFDLPLLDTTALHAEMAVDFILS